MPPQLPLRDFKGFYVPGNLEELLLFCNFLGTSNISLVRCLQMSIATRSEGLGNKIILFSLVISCFLLVLLVLS